MMFIYKTTNLINNIIYIGKYCGSNNNYLGSGTYLKRAIKKYGKENFSRIILEDGIEDHDYLCKREIYWIDFYDSANPKIGYNLTKGGKGNFGWIPSKETKKKMSKFKIEKYVGENNPFYGKKHSQEARKKMSENHADVSGKNHPMFGKHHTQESRRKMSKSKVGKYVGENNPMFGKHPSLETRRKMSESAKNRNPISEETRDKISKSHADFRGKNHPRIIKKEIILKIKGMLRRNIPMKNIIEELKIGRSTIYKVKNGWYDKIYNI